MNQSAPASTPTRRPTLGLIAQIVGIVGAILCVLAIVGVLMGRGIIQDRVEVLANGASKALDQAVAVADQALVGLEQGAADAAEVRVAAETLAANPAIDEIALAALQERLAPLAARYGELRDRYVVLREQTTGFLDTIDRLGRLVPGIDLPDGPVEFVAGMDEKLTALDQAITDISARAAERSGASETATLIATGVGRLEDGIVSATEQTQNVKTGLQEVQDDVLAFSDRVGSLIGISSTALAIILAWFGLLHLALWALGRRWRAA